jgi:hypothetical protein
MMRLVDSKTFDSGVVMLTYQPAPKEAAELPGETV